MRALDLVGAQAMWVRQREHAREQLQRRLQERRDRQVVRQQHELERVMEMEREAR